MARLVILFTALVLAVAPANAAAPRSFTATRATRSAATVRVTKPIFETPPTTFVRSAAPPKIALPPAQKKQRWSRESTRHAVRIGLAIGAPFVAPTLAAHVPILASGLAVGFGLYAAQGAIESLRAGYRAAKATPRDGWWTPYDKFAAFVGGFFGSRDGLSKLFLGGGVAAEIAASVFTAVPSLATIGSELVKSGVLRAAMNIFIPQRVAVVGAVAVAETQPKR